MFNFFPPTTTGYGDMLCPVDEDLLDHAKTLIGEREEASQVANQEFQDICQSILQKSSFPGTADGCLAAHLMLVQEFTAAMNSNDIQIPPTFQEANEVYKVLHRQRMEGNH